MADDFRALIEEQKKTTRALLKGEQQAEMDADIAESQHKDKIKSDLRIEAGRKAWQTRQSNKELSAGGAAAKEDAQEQAAGEEKTQGLLGKIAGGVTGMFGKMMAPVKGAGKGIMAMLKGTLVAGLLLAVLAFLESKYWTQTKDFLINTILPALETFWEVLKDNWKPIAIAFGVISAAFLVFKGVMIAGKLIVAIKAISAGFLAVKAFFSATLLPAVTGFMVPLLPIIAIVAAISLVLWSLWSAFSDAQDTFEETGSITEALKVGISKFIGTLLGFIPDLVLKLVGWVAGLFGFDDFKKKIQTINVTQWIADTIKGLFDDIHKWFTGLWSWAEATGAGIEGGWSLSTFIKGVWDSVVGWFKGLWTWGKTSEDTIGGGFSLFGTISGIFSNVITWIKQLFTDPLAALKTLWTTLIKGYASLMDLLFSPVKSAITWVMKLFGWDEAAAATEKFSIKTFILGVFDTVKKWITGLFSWGEGVVTEGWTNLTTYISGIWTTVKEWFTKLFSWGTGVVTEGWTNLTTYISGIWDSVYGWFTGLWSWGTGVATKGWTNLTGFIKGVWDSVYGWFTGLWSWGAEKGKTPDGEAWSLTKMISDVFKSAKDWFVGLFTWKKVEPKEGGKQFSVAQLLLDLWEDIKTALSSIFPSLSDLKELLPSFSDVKNTVKGWFGFGGSSKKEEVQKVKPAAPKTGPRGFPVKEIKEDKLVITPLARQLAHINLISPRTAQLFLNKKKKEDEEALKAMVIDKEKHRASKQKTEEIQTAGIKRTGRAATAPAIVNAPVNSISNSQTNTTVASTELKHPSTILNEVVRAY